MRILFCGALCAAAFAAGRLGGRRAPQAPPPAQSSAAAPVQTPPAQAHPPQKAGLTNPLLECSVSNAAGFWELRPFKGRIEQLIARQLAAGNGTHISVYFRDLNNGPWFGIHEQEKFAPASLLKVPVMAAYFKWEEEEPGVLKRELCFRQPLETVRNTIRPSKEIELGNCYSISSLIERMIVYSDNEAKNLLILNLPEERFVSAYTDMGVELPSTGSDDIMSVKSYASFFRVLYNTSYLKKSSSERALSLLARTEYANALRAGVPKTIRVAHKFGERERGEVQQLHDCGIVYYPDRPYLLCVMSRGDDRRKLEAGIAAISRAVYREIDRQHSSQGDPSPSKD